MATECQKNYHKMDEIELSRRSIRKQARQPVSIPFVWEEKPGTPKRDWKPSIQTVHPIVPAPPPVKLVASVPFKWEEKPGKPLPCFPQPPPQVEIDFPPENLVDKGNEEEQYRIFESDLAECGFETDESFSSAPSLPSNRVVSSLAVSNDVPLMQTILTGNNSGELKSPSSPASETGSSRSSYATGTASLVGEAFLECLFPLLSPKSNFPEKLNCTEKSTSHAPTKAQSRDFDCKSNCSVSVRRPTTLGELIMTSRRRSYRRKAVQMRRQNLSMESMKMRAVGCCIFGINNTIERLQQKWNRQLRLKLM